MVGEEPLNTFQFDFDFNCITKRGMISGRHGKMRLRSVADLEDLQLNLDIGGNGIKKYLTLEMQTHLQLTVFGVENITVKQA